MTAAERRAIDFEDHYEALRDVADILGQHRSLPELFAELAKPLHKAALFEFASLALKDQEKGVMRLHVWEGSGATSVPAEIPIAKSPSGWVMENQQVLMAEDLHSDPRFPQVFDIFREQGLRSYCLMPLTTARNQLGAMGFGSSRTSAFRDRDLRLLARVADLVALALENSNTRQALHDEKTRLQALLEVNQALISTPDLQRRFPAISEFIGRVTRHDCGRLAVYEEATASLRLFALDAPKSQGGHPPILTVSCDQDGRGVNFLKRARTLNCQALPSSQAAFVQEMMGPGVKSFCSIPLVSPKGWLGALNLGNRQEDAFAQQDTSFLEQVAAQVAMALDNARAYREIAELKDKLSKEKLYLEGEILSELNFEEIVGESPALKRVLSQAKIVAPSDATALVLGETGTGKELIARAIHRMSSRKDGSFIKLNCAAIPTGLLESELFGHEKGAFTGAISQKLGRLELADGGTLFLDEVGDIPLELQPKLLRVLQDQEFERLGSNRTIKVNVRLIAATNRDLAKSVAAREFRSDLYYRLNVFPLRTPPLRDRRTDIPLLVRYFVQRFARSMKRQIETIRTETMNALVNWEWPGNVRELENFIERSVILSSGPVLMVPLAELRPLYEQPAKASTLESIERAHIVRTLRETHGVISGSKGAAVQLGLKRTTLQSRIQRMGIARSDYEG